MSEATPMFERAMTSFERAMRWMELAEMWAEDCRFSPARDCFSEAMSHGHETEGAEFERFMESARRMSARME